MTICNVLWPVRPAGLVAVLLYLVAGPSFGQAVTTPPADANTVTAEALDAKPPVSFNPNPHPLGIVRGPHILPKRVPKHFLNSPLSPSGPHLTYYGGRVASNLQVVQVIWGKIGPFLPQVTSIATPSMATFYQEVMDSPYVDWLSTEYDTIGLPAPTSNQIIGRGTFGGQYVIIPTTITGTTVDDTDIQTELAFQISAGHLPAPIVDASGNPNTYYAIFFPHGTTITTAQTRQGNSCVNWCAYHSTIAATSAFGELFYGVHPDMQAGSGCDVGCGAAAAPFDNYTSTASHEMIETITDGEVGLATALGPPLAWYDATNGEAADICNQNTSSIVGSDGQTYTVQEIWSNALGACVALGPLLPTDFSISATPTSVSINAGNSATVAINTSVTSGSAVTVAPTVSGIPAGVLASISPASVTSGQGATLILSAASATGAGSHTFTVTGTSGAIVHTASVLLTIQPPPPPPDFSISAAPAGVSINAGDHGTVSINTAVISGSAITVALAVSGAPAGVTTTLTPTTVASGQSAILSLSVSGSAATGIYPLTVTGTSGALSHTANFTLTISPPPLMLGVVPSTLDFGVVRQFSLLAKTVTLKNTGSGAVSISNVSVTPSGGTGSTVFTSLRLCPSSLTAGRSCTIYVLLVANRLGSQSATLNIPNSAVGSAQTVPISANVTKTGH
jgi:hypothetical protein